MFLRVLLHTILNAAYPFGICCFSLSNYSSFDKSHFIFDFIADFGLFLFSMTLFQM